MKRNIQDIAIVNYYTRNNEEKECSTCTHVCEDAHRSSVRIEAKKKEELWVIMITSISPLDFDNVSIYTSCLHSLLLE